MVPPNSSVAGSPAARAVARRYNRIERAVSGAFALVVAGLFVTALLSLSLVPGLLVAVAILAILRVPAFRSAGTIRLSTDAAPEAVRADFESATPPPLALQWGIADAVTAESERSRYAFSYLLGLRSTEMTVEVRDRRSAADTAAFELRATAGGRPWGTYAISIRDRRGTTLVDVEVDSDRRFGLRRLPQWLVANRYQSAAMAAQGYTVVDRDVTLSR